MGLCCLTWPGGGTRKATPAPDIWGIQMRVGEGGLGLSSVSAAQWPALGRSCHLSELQSPHPEKGGNGGISVGVLQRNRTRRIFKS